MCIAKNNLQGAEIDFELSDKCTSNKELWISYLREANIKVPFEDSNPISNDSTYGLQHGNGCPFHYMCPPWSPSSSLLSL